MSHNMLVLKGQQSQEESWWLESRPDQPEARVRGDRRTRALGRAKTEGCPLAHRVQLVGVLRVEPMPGSSQGYQHCFRPHSTTKLRSSSVIGLPQPLGEWRPLQFAIRTADVRRLKQMRPLRSHQSRPLAVGPLQPVRPPHATELYRFSQPTTGSRQNAQSLGHRVWPWNNVRLGAHLAVQHEYRTPGAPVTSQTESRHRSRQAWPNFALPQAEVN